MGRAGRRWLLPLVAPAGVLALWVAAVQWAWVEPYQLPPPAKVLATVAKLLGDGDLTHHVGVTLGRLVAGFALGAAPGIVLGAAAGLVPGLRLLLDPTIQGLRAIPSLAWVPLFLLWFGIGELARVLLIALGAFLPVYLNVLAGVENVDRKLLEVGRVYELGRFALARRIILPAALPGLMTGLRAGLSLAWMFVVAAELIAASEGLGFLLVDGQYTARPEQVILSLLAFGLLGRLSDALLYGLERRVLHWRDAVQPEARGA
ncbi:MAG TPA: ABC transporter permease [Bacillota bacterium]